MFEVEHRLVVDMHLSGEPPKPRFRTLKWIMYQVSFALHHTLDIGGKHSLLLFLC